MGEWMNLAFVESDDVERVTEVLGALVVERGRVLVTPLERVPEPYDPMQYGRGDEVGRWGVLALAGAPGWTCVVTMPLELLQVHEPPLLARLARALGRRAFQIDLYDGSGGFLMESDAAGRVEMSGFAPDPTTYWGAGAPPEERVHMRFRVIDVGAAATSASGAPWDQPVPILVMRERGGPHDAPERARYLAMVDERARGLARFFAARGLAPSPDAAPPPSGSTFTWSTYRVAASEVVRALGTEDAGLFAANDVAQAVRRVFAGAAADVVWDAAYRWLLPHRPAPIELRHGVLYADRASG